jgi:hypothetical protein
MGVIPARSLTVGALGILLATLNGLKAYESRVLRAGGSNSLISMVGDDDIHT